MKMSAKGVKLLAQWEGFKKLKYKDHAGKWTIGVGHLITPDELQRGSINVSGRMISINKPWTDEDVRVLLAQDLVRFEKDVDATIKVDLNQNQFDALVSFAFNIGTGAFNSEIGVAEALNAGMHGDVPRQLRKWNKAGGKVSQGLVNRRENEIKLWNGGL